MAKAQYSRGVQSMCQPTPLTLAMMATAEAARDISMLANNPNSRTAAPVKARKR